MTLIGTKGSTEIETAFCIIMLSCKQIINNIYNICKFFIKNHLIYF